MFCRSWIPHDRNTKRHFVRAGAQLAWRSADGNCRRSRRGRIRDDWFWWWNNFPLFFLKIQKNIIFQNSWTWWWVKLCRNEGAEFIYYHENKTKTIFFSWNWKKRELTRKIEDKLSEERRDEWFLFEKEFSKRNSDRFFSFSQKNKYTNKCKQSFVPVKMYHAQGIK